MTGIMSKEIETPTHSQTPLTFFPISSFLSFPNPTATKSPFIQILIKNKKHRIMGLRSLFNRNKDLIPSSTPSRSTSMSVRSRTRMAAELEQVFHKFDVNGDGKIDASELGAIMGSLGQKATEQELINMLREVDGDGDGYISLQEFIELNTKGVDSDEVLENLKEAFSVFDIDGNGSITAEELNTVMRSLGEECTLAECRRMISGVDSDGDGMIDFEEFRVMMMMGSRHDTTNRVLPDPDY
ncbi:hypothetical protein HN51_013827 [Arachis hypogaea]|uniref:EF-hand domain-containing protein n=5 Tax=Arachis TaxID=3817 RepID=A0A445DNM2_ARAHY|nr:probable calcium-binding protein CML25 [Arachis ipaensis]XP_025639191.1 probable calcium-binding protein CML25 [Arachis hypogaea]RYR64741.1 hypothetical protein Ahy_A03g010803 isoform A [Arachis hypogaea]